jgi:hypothetical protein
LTEAVVVVVGVVAGAVVMAAWVAPAEGAVSTPGAFELPHAASPNAAHASTVRSISRLVTPAEASGPS